MADNKKVRKISTNNIEYDVEDTQAVHKTTDDEISGVKQFTEQLAIPTQAPAANKMQVGAIWVEID